jgi:hypothetical protein
MCIINHPDQNPNENLFSHHSFHDSISMTEREREREARERETRERKPRRQAVYKSMQRWAGMW